jgi:hypothetical protein
MHCLIVGVFVLLDEVVVVVVVVVVFIAVISFDSFLPCSHV